MPPPISLAVPLSSPLRTLCRQFVLFMLNGGLIGLLCWGLQMVFYRALGQGGTATYWVSSLGAAALGIVVNYQMQRRIIFARHGNFWHFAAAATAMSIAVSGAAVLGREVLLLVLDPANAARFGFVLGAMAVAPVSFAIKKWLIFRG